MMACFDCVFFYNEGTSEPLYKKPRLYVKVGTKFAEKLRKHVRVMDEVYTPTWWCPFGFMQTLVRQLFRSRPSLPWEREIVRFSDGGQAALDWLHPAEEKAREDKNTPIVIFLPGICGSTHDSPYLMHAAMECNQRQGWRVAVSNARGLGGVKLTTPRTYNASQTEDIQAVVKMISEIYPNARKIGCGFSLGGMILWNYLAKCKSAEETGLHGAMIVSSPWNSMPSTASIETFWPRVLFNQHILASLLDLVRPYRDMFEGIVDWEKTFAAKTIREFDMAFVVPLFGYKNYEEYYHESALYYKVHQIPVPMLAVNAADDCFAPEFTIPFNDVCRSENVAVCFTQHGGHTAFMQGTNPSDIGFAEKIIMEFGHIVFEETDE